MKTIKEDILTTNSIDWYKAQCWHIFKDKNFNDFIKTVEQVKVPADLKQHTESMTNIQEGLSDIADYLDMVIQWFAGLKDTAIKIWERCVLIYKMFIPVMYITTAVYVLYKTSEIWVPKVQLLIRRLLAGNALAYCKFSTDEHNYILKFDLTKYAWTLDYTGFKSSILNHKYKPSSEEFYQLTLQPEFKTFVNKCYQITNNMLTDKQQLAYLAILSEDNKLSSKFRQICKTLIKEPDKILTRMRFSRISV
jgi:hypothetical protein